MQAKISIALASFNGGKYLEEQLDSIYRQTICPYEVIVCDDKSTDNTFQILEKYSKEKGLKYFINETPLGVIQNFSKAISLTNGDYISLADQDDIWNSNKLEILLKTIKEIESKDKPALVHANSIILKDGEKQSNLLFPNKDNKGLNKYIFLPNGQGANMMFNRSLVKYILPIPEGLYMHDYYFVIICEIIGVRKYISEPLMQYRIHNNNTLGLNEKLLLKRIHRFWENNFSILSNKIFATIEAILNNDKLKIETKNKIILQHILELNNDKISKMNKLINIWRYKFSNLSGRILMSCKIILKK